VKKSVYCTELLHTLYMSNQVKAYKHINI
jgi:hypothetical protein